MASAGETTGRPPDEEEIPLCTPSNCPPDEDQYKLKCNNCQRVVHYKCTELPLYQLNQFLTRGYRNFICVNCIEAPEHLHDIVPDNQASTSCLTNIITDLTTKLQKISTENDCYKVKNLKLTENNQKPCNDIQKYEEGSKRGLRRLTSSKPKMLTSHEENEMKLKRLINRQENELKEQEQKFNEVGNPDFDNIVQLEACMKKELHLIGKGIKESLLHEVQENNKQVEEKLNKVLNQRVKYADSVRSEESGVNQSKPTEITDFRTIIKEARNEELAEQTEKRRRACNILHGKRGS